MSFNEKLKNFFDVYHVINSGIEKLHNEADDDGNIDRRVLVSLIKEYHSLHEAILFNLRQLIIAKNATTENPKLEPEEICILEEKEYKLNKCGILSYQDKYHNARGLIVFTLNCFAKSFSLDKPDIKSSDGLAFGAYIKSINIRNRLVHPKTLKGLEISPQDKMDFDRAIKWFDKIVGGLILDAIEQDNDFKNAYATYLSNNSPIQKK